MERNSKIAVLLMAYGTPNTLEEVEPYYTDIRGGRRPTPEKLKELVERYQRIGGRTPLLDITRAQATALQSLLDRESDRFQVFIGMKHWHPYIAEAIREIHAAGHHRLLAIALAPHYSKFSIDGYLLRVRAALQQVDSAIELAYVESWNDHPLFLKAIAERMDQARAAFGNVTWEEIQVIFSAHSLPERILQSNDPYPRELEETCRGIARLIGLRQWRFAYQSAGRTGEKWLGPDLLATLEEIVASGQRRVLIAPIGFVADHLEVLYDIDVECAERARALGLEMHRIESPNAYPTFIQALAALVRENA